MSVAAVNLLNPEFTRNPAEGFGRLCEQAPVVPVLFPGLTAPVWLITRYEDVKKVVIDPRFVLDRDKVTGVDGPTPSEQMMTDLGIPDDYRKYSPRTC